MRARTSKRILVAGGLSIALAGAATPLSAGDRSFAGSAALGTCDSAPGYVVATRVRLPGKPGSLLRVGNRLWVAIGSVHPGGRGRLARVDARSGRIERLIPLPTDPSRVAYGFGSLWVTGETHAARYGFPVVRVEPRSGRVVDVIRGPKRFGTAIAATSDGVWVGGNDVYRPGRPDETLMRWIFKIDPRTNSVVRSVRLNATTAIVLAADGSSVWAAGWGAVAKVSASGRAIVQKRFGGSGWSLSIAPSAVWIAQPFFGNRRDPHTQRPARRLLRLARSGQRARTTVELDAQPGDVTANGDDLWVGPFRGVESWLGHVDAARIPVVVERVGVDVVPSRMAAFPGGVWVADRQRSELSKIC